MAKLDIDFLWLFPGGTTTLPPFLLFGGDGLMG
jgi:hypothetical protein